MHQLDIFGTQTYEYLLVIEPDSKTTDKVIAMRELLNKTIPIMNDSLKSKPHISLCYFEANDSSEEIIISKMKQAVSLIEPFDILLKGSEKWKNGTFILKIEQNVYIEQLQRELSAVFKGIIKNPHLTIARNIPEQILNQLSLEEYDYNGYFTCESVLLLKRSENEPYQLLDEIYFSKR